MFDQSRSKLRAIIAASILTLSLGTASAPARADHGADIIGPAIAFLALGTILQHGNQYKHYKYYKRYRHHGNHRRQGRQGYDGYSKRNYRRDSHSYGDYYAYKRKARKYRKHW